MNNVSKSIKKTLPKTKLPPWLAGMVRKQVTIENRFEKAHTEFAEIYNEFLMMLEDLNERFGTQFTVEQALTEFGNEITDECDDDDED